MIEARATIALARHDAQHAEAADHEEGVGDGIEQHRRDAFVRGGLDADKDEARVADRGVGEHALCVALHDRHERADHEGEDRQAVDRRLPVVGVVGERRHEDPDQRRKACRLDRRGHEGHHRGRRTLIDVGSPGVERSRRDLETEPDEQHRHARHQQPVLDKTVLLEEVSDHDQVRGADGAVGQGDAVQQERRGERAEDEVLETGLLALGAAHVHRCHHVHRDAQRLEGEEQHDEVVRARHDGTTSAREQHQDVHLGAGHALTFEVVVEE